MTYSQSHQNSSDELKLLAIMRRDSDILRSRELEDETAVPAPKRSEETRARIAAKMRGNTNRKIKTDCVPGRNPEDEPCLKPHISVN